MNPAIKLSSSKAQLSLQKDGDLSGQDLSGQDLSGQDLSGVNLSNANLSGANLQNANLEGALLYQANLDNSELFGANLRGADLTECSAEKANFAHCNLVDARLFGAKLSGVCFNGASLQNANFSAATLVKARFRDADLSGTNFGCADLQKIDLNTADVSGANFDGSDMRGAHVRGTVGYNTASWIHADMQNVDYCGAYMLRRSVMDQNYLYEFRNQSKTSLWIYRVWWLTSNCGRSIGRWAAFTLLLAIAFGACYSQLSLSYSHPETALSPYYFSVVTLTTLGYGDVLPASTSAQYVVMLQVIIGYVMLGGLLSIFAENMGRRAA